jgi:hypothetical protein
MSGTIIIATTDMLKALEDYMASVKLGANHAARVVVLAHRVQVLGELHSEMHAALLVEHEAAKDSMDSSDMPEPPAYKDFLAHYAEFKVINKLLNESIKDMESEKEFIEWHAATNVLPEYTTAMKLLGNAGQETKPENTAPEGGK